MHSTVVVVVVAVAPVALAVYSWALAGRDTPSLPPQNSWGVDQQIPGGIHWELALCNPFRVSEECQQASVRLLVGYVRMVGVEAG